MSNIKYALGSEFTDAQLNYAPLAGAAIGGLGGAIFSKKKNMLRNALIGAATGGLAGGLGAAGYRHGVKPWDLKERANRTLLQTKALQDYATNWDGFMSNHDTDLERKMQNAISNNIFHARGLGMGALGVAGGLGLGGLAAAAAPNDDDDTKHKGEKMSADTDNCCENKKPMRVYSAGESTTDITPKKVGTEHSESVLTGDLAQKAAQAMQIVTARMQKSAGPISEVISGFNPLNMYGGAHLGGLAALAMPTRSLARQAEYDSTDNPLRALGNALVPGMGPYNAFKRLGAGIRSPEMKQIKARRQADKLKRELEYTLPKEEEKAESPEPKKEAGWKSEMAGIMLNPINWVANYPGAAMAAATPTRTLDEQAGADEEIVGNLLLPGRAAYNHYKRMGATTRSPEMLALQAKAKQRKMQKLLAASGQAPEEAPAKQAGFVDDTMAQGIGGLKGQALGLGAGVAGGGLLGALYGAYDPGAKAVLDENGKPVVKRRSRIMSALRGGLQGSLLGGMAGNFAGHAIGRHMAAPAPTPKTASALNFGMKVAFDIKGTDLVAPAVGAGLGALGGTMLGKKKEKIRSALMGAALGAGAGGVAEHMLPGLGLGAKFLTEDIGTGLRRAVGQGPNTLEQMGMTAKRLKDFTAEGIRRKSMLPGAELLYRATEGQFE